MNTSPETPSRLDNLPTGSPAVATIEYIFIRIRSEGFGLDEKNGLKKALEAIEEENPPLTEADRTIIALAKDLAKEKPESDFHWQG